MSDAINALLLNHPLPWRAHECGDGYIWDANGEIVASMGSTATKDDNIALLSSLIVNAPAALASLKMAEEFMSGFEGDEMQEGISAKLATVRATIAQLEKGE